MIPFPKKKYHLIYADPPWQYNSAYIIGGKNNRKRKQLEENYPTMTLEDIKSLPISTISQDNCVLFLWATPPLLPESLEVIESWGFSYKTIAYTWVKLEQDSRPFFGLGSYTKSNCELCLLGVKGNVGRLTKGNTDPFEKLCPISNSESQVITTTRINRDPIFHSMKPDKVAKSIERLFGDINRVELFARRKREGWDVWGNEV